MKRLILVVALIGALPGCATLVESTDIYKRNVQALELEKQAAGADSQIIRTMSLKAYITYREMPTHDRTRPAGRYSTRCEYNYQKTQMCIVDAGPDRTLCYIYPTGAMDCVSD